MRRRSAAFHAWLFGALVGLLGGAPARPAALPTLRIEAPSDLEGVARELATLDPSTFEPAMRLTGLDEPGPPIRVVLVGAGTPAPGAAPWFSGLADGASGTVWLFPDRVGRYPDRGLVSLLQHEVAHVLVERAARPGEVPRWFSEGLAMIAGRETDLGDRARAALAGMSSRRWALARLDRAFYGEEREVTAAYALARDVVHAILREHGGDAGARILAGVARGRSFDEAFLDATGIPLRRFERDYWSRGLWRRWAPLLTNSTLAWGLAAVLVVLAYLRRRRRDREIAEAWAAEEATAAMPPDETIH